MVVISFSVSKKLSSLLYLHRKYSHKRKPAVQARVPTLSGANQYINHWLYNIDNEFKV